MVKLAGSFCVLMGGLLGFRLWAAQRRSRSATLKELLCALRRMEEEIRVSRTPLPELLETLSAECGSEASNLFQQAARAARCGELEEGWRQGAEALPLIPADREAVQGLRLNRGEQELCGGIALVVSRLEKSEEELDRTGPEETKRTAAVCFSGAALLVILLL